MFEDLLFLIDLVGVVFAAVGAPKHFWEDK